MRFQSTRDHSQPPHFVDLASALNAGLAPDGGLFVPESLPQLEFQPELADAGLPAVAAYALAPFFAGSSLETQLEDICNESLNLPLPVHAIAALNAGSLELFHGPSAAFKDFAARFLAACMQRLRQSASRVVTVLVATSGDTGGAVAAAFHRKPGFRVVILYPEGRVSPRQAHQLSAFGDNIQTFAVQGSFDDCQALVKRAFGDQDLRQRVEIVSANSISLGRLLPQMAYYVFVALRHHLQHGEPARLIIPSGNLGHGLGALMARSIGAPIEEIVLASNANDVLVRFFAHGRYEPTASLSTLANAMDVGAPSNFERLHWLSKEQRPDGMRAFACADADIQQQIRALAELDYVICPHTACGFHALQQLRTAGDQRHYLIAATAHPAKFDDVVEPLLGRQIDVPALLAERLAHPARAHAMALDYQQLVNALEQA